MGGYRLSQLSADIPGVKYAASERVLDWQQQKLKSFAYPQKKVLWNQCRHTFANAYI